MDSTGTDQDVSTISLHNAVFCVDCESISNSPHDVCTICGSHSLVGLFRLLGGTLLSHKAQTSDDAANGPRYNLDVTFTMQEIPAKELNHAIQVITRLADVGGELDRLHINVECVMPAHGGLRAA
jgi:hypothetical protein